jgi:hypothetical protein
LFLEALQWKTFIDNGVYTAVPIVFGAQRENGMMEQVEHDAARLWHRPPCRWFSMD